MNADEFAERCYNEWALAQDYDGSPLLPYAQLSAPQRAMLLRTVDVARQEERARAVNVLGMVMAAALRHFVDGTGCERVVGDAAQELTDLVQRVLRGGLRPETAAPAEAAGL